MEEQEFDITALSETELHKRLESLDIDIWWFDLCAGMAEMEVVEIEEELERRAALKAAEGQS